MTRESQEEREDRYRLEELRAEARYRRERLELYRARMYGGKAGDGSRLAELERAHKGAAARLARAEAAREAPDE